jgi:hypothetical protein
MAKMRGFGRKCSKSEALKAMADEWARDHPVSKMAWVTHEGVKVTEVRGELVKGPDGVWRLENQTQIDARYEV